MHNEKKSIPPPPPKPRNENPAASDTAEGEREQPKFFRDDRGFSWPNPVSANKSRFLEVPRRKTIVEGFLGLGESTGFPARPNAGKTNTFIQIGHDVTRHLAEGEKRLLFGIFPILMRARMLVLDFEMPTGGMFGADGRNMKLLPEDYTSDDFVWYPFHDIVAAHPERRLELDVVTDQKNGTKRFRLDSIESFINRLLERLGWGDDMPLILALDSVTSLVCGKVNELNNGETRSVGEALTELAVKRNWAVIGAFHTPEKVNERDPLSWIRGGSGYGEQLTHVVGLAKTKEELDPETGKLDHVHAILAPGKARLDGKWPVTPIYRHGLGFWGPDANPPKGSSNGGHAAGRKPNLTPEHVSSEIRAHCVPGETLTFKEITQRCSWEGTRTMRKYVTEVAVGNNVLVPDGKSGNAVKYRILPPQETATA